MTQKLTQEQRGAIVSEGQKMMQPAIEKYGIKVITEWLLDDDKVELLRAMAKLNSEA